MHFARIIVERIYREPLKLISVATFMLGTALLTDSYMGLPNQEQLVVESITPSDIRLLGKAGSPIYFGAKDSDLVFSLGPFDTWREAEDLLESMPRDASTVTITYYPKEPDREGPSVFTAYRVSIDDWTAESFPDLPLGWRMSDVRSMAVAVGFIVLAIFGFTRRTIRYNAA